MGSSQLLQPVAPRVHASADPVSSLLLETYAYALGPGETFIVPANAPHAFINAAAPPAWLLRVCSPAGLKQFFLVVGDRVAERTGYPPELSAAAQAARRAKAGELAPQFRTELLGP